MFRFTVFLLSVALLVGCAGQAGPRPERPDNDPVETGPVNPGGKADGFDWGSGCKGGSGTFNQSITKDAVVTVGTIPSGKANVHIKLTSAKDVDIQLFHGTKKIVQWPDGILNGEGKASTTYKGVKITWSGYNGDGTNPGNEYIKLEGVTQNAFVMKAYGYAAGQARIEYKWDAKPNCNDSGSGTFTQAITKDAVVTVGTIPAGLSNVKIQLKSTVDIDIQLFDGTKKIVQWPDGILNAATKSSTTYKGVKITWSGYNGDGTGKGNEYIQLEGKTTNAFVMKAFGYQAGSATVTYSWGGSGGGTGGVKSFADRLKAFALKYSSHVTVATKQGKPAIFVNTQFCASQSKTKTFYGELYSMVGPSTVMIWNPAGENYFHMALGKGASSTVDSRFRNRSIRLYSHIHIWDISLGNMDDECSSSSYDPNTQYVDLITSPCYDSDQVDLERTVALIKLSATQLKGLDTYLKAMVSDFDGTLGPADYYGGTPPYFGGSKHNCTSWFSTFLNRKVNSGFSTSANPASLMKSVTGGGYSGQLLNEFRALLVFNHPNPPADGATISKNFTLEFGH